jgi:cytochrome bd ubiquinol oxidase subunit II
VILWGAFPLAYATLMSAFYIPVIIMLLGLILRGGALEFRGKTRRLRWIWDLSFAGGSLVASFMQGVTVGALVEGLPLTNGEYSGGVFGWLSSFSVLCCFGLCLGYVLLGASWLVRKCHSDVCDAARRQIPFFALAVLAFLVIVVAHALLEDLPIMRRWIDRPYLFLFPTLGAGAALVLATSILHHDDDLPFYAVALIFASAFGTLALPFWPYMIPFAITIDQAAAPHASLAFMFWGEGLFVFPLTPLYVAIGCRVFSGKVGSASMH